MLTKQRKVTVELLDEKQQLKSDMTNPIVENYKNNKIAEMVRTILDKELPMYKHNSLLHDLVIYTVLEKMDTVQNVKNVLSYIKDNCVKEVRDVYFRNGEVRIKCSI